MKKLTLLLPILLCALITVPANAKYLPKLLKDKVQRKVINPQISHKRFPEKTQDKKLPRCAACGEEILDRAQHCAATGYTGLCGEGNAEPAKRDTPSDPCICPVCGHEYTIDEKYHGVEHSCTPKTEKSASRGGNGGEPETEAVFIGSGEPANPGMNGGEPETEYFFVADEQETQFGGNGGEPVSPGYEELNPSILHQAEARLQADRDAHDGRAMHSLGYYYHQVWFEQKANGGETSSSSYEKLDPKILHQAEARLQADRDANDGRATHGLGYYYHQVLSEQNTYK